MANNSRSNNTDNNKATPLKYQTREGRDYKMFLQADLEIVEIDWNRETSSSTSSSSVANQPGTRRKTCKNDTAVGKAKNVQDNDIGKTRDSGVETRRIEGRETVIKPHDSGPEYYQTTMECTPPVFDATEESDKRSWGACSSSLLSLSPMTSLNVKEGREHTDEHRIKRKKSRKVRNGFFSFFFLSRILYKGKNPTYTKELYPSKHKTFLRRFKDVLFSGI